MPHLARGSVGEGQPEDGFARQLRIRLQQITDALRDDAGLARACARHHQQRPRAMFDNGALLCVELLAAFRRRRREFEKIGHTAILAHLSGARTTPGGAKLTLFSRRAYTECVSTKPRSEPDRLQRSKPQCYSRPSVSL